MLVARLARRLSRRPVSRTARLTLHSPCTLRPGMAAVESAGRSRRKRRLTADASNSVRREMRTLPAGHLCSGAPVRERAFAMRIVDIHNCPTGVNRAW